MSFRQINPAFEVVALSGDALLIHTIDYRDLEDRVAEQLGCSGSEARMSLGQWLEFALQNHQYIKADA